MVSAFYRAKGVTDPLEYRETKYFKMVAKLCAREAAGSGTAVDWAKTIKIALKIGAMIEGGEIAAPALGIEPVLKMAANAAQHAFKLFAMPWAKLDLPEAIPALLSLAVDAWNFWKQARQIAAQLRVCIAAWKEGAAAIEAAIKAEG